MIKTKALVANIVVQPLLSKFSVNDEIKRLRSIKKVLRTRICSIPIKKSRLLKNSECQKTAVER